jgi:drug/metabolite transporter (DMT)-like permease
MMATGAIFLVPAAIAGWLFLGRPPVPPEAIALGILSGGLEAVYFSFLAAAYRRGALSIVYPLARGSATLFAVAIGVLLLGERLGTIGQAGLVVLLAGFLWLQRPWQIVRSALRRRVEGGVMFAVATGLVIALYSSVDRVGVQQTEPWLYAAIIWTSASVCLIGLAAYLELRRPAPAAAIAVGAHTGGTAGDPLNGARAPGTGAVLAAYGIDGRSFAGGIIGVVQYVLILAALSIAPLSAVSPLRESAVVLATGWGAFRLGEAARRRDGVARVAASGLIVVGAILLGLDG